MSKESMKYTKTLNCFGGGIVADFRTLKASVKFCSDPFGGDYSVAAEVKALRKETGFLIQSNQDLREEN